MPPELRLPHPDSDELRTILPGRVHQVIYRLMYEHRDEGITRPQLRVLAALEGIDQEQLDRRARDLNKKFIVERRHQGRQVLHHLRGVREDPGADIDDGITGAQRWRVLEKGKCFGCGKRPDVDDIKLVVDHIIPRHLGGPSEDWNLQPLCEQCNAEKKERFSAYNEHADKIRRAMSYAEVQRRIGELLLAFGGEPVPADLVQVVASAGEYRNDWERRFRDLRTLGWKVHVRKFKQGNRFTSEYWVEEAQPWPDEPIHLVLARASHKKRKARRNGG